MKTRIVHIIILLIFIATAYDTMAIDNSSQQLLSKADSLYTKRQYSKALPIYQKVLPALHEKNKIAEVSLAISGCLLYVGKIDSSILYADTALFFNKQVSDTSGIVNCYIFLGTCNNRLGNFEISIEHNLNALRHAKESNNLNSIADCYSTLGSLYYTMGNYEESIRYTRLVLEMDKQSGNSMYIAVDYNELGSTYYKLNNIDSSSFYFSLAYNILQNIDAPDYLVISLNGLALVATSNKQYDKALQLHKEAMAINKRIGRTGQVAVNLNNLGTLLSKQEKYDEAIFYLKQAIEINKKVGNRPLIKDNLKNLANFNYYLENYKEAFDYTNAYNKLRDTLLNEDMNKRIANLQVEYETKEKQNMIKLQQAEISKKERILFNVIIALIVVIFLLILIYWQYKQKNKAYKALYKKNLEIENQYKTTISIDDTYQNSTENNENEVLKELFDKVIEKFEKDNIFKKDSLNIDELAKIMETNRKYLFDSIKKYSGKTINQFINYYRIMEAKILLTESNLKIEAVGVAVGYNSVNTFRSNFEKITGLKPSIYRKQGAFFKS